MKITISGHPGAGKGELIKVLREKYKLTSLSVGDFRGKMAMDMGMTVDELNKLGETEDFTDRQADEYQRKWAQEHDNFIVEGRLSYYFIPDSIKIYLDVSLEEAARRIFNAQHERPDEADVKTLEEMIEALRKRVESDRKRYRRIYNGLDYENKDNFDFYLDTTHLTQSETAVRVIDFIQKNYKPVRN